MGELDEWSFDFRVSATPSLPKTQMDDLMDVAILWVEALGLSIGGGFRPSVGESDEVTEWHWCFGLYRRGGRVIPASIAQALEAGLREWCVGRGLTFSGGCRDFSPEEAAVSEPGPPDREA